MIQAFIMFMFSHISNKSISIKYYIFFPGRICVYLQCGCKAGHLVLPPLSRTQNYDELPARDSGAIYTGGPQLCAPFCPCLNLGALSLVLVLSFDYCSYRPCAPDIIVHSQPRSAGNVPPYWVSRGMLLTHAFTVGKG